ncbi:adenylyl cyclase X E isoform X1 [Tribolium castaneum]|uniref:adenylyl cyclase X E isoform X1 n=2 Tax=Tribolium castaneum TaxID=7070 RepID=UPI0030FF16AE
MYGDIEVGEFATAAEAVARLSISSQIQHPNSERRWRLSYLKAQFESLELHQLFRRYGQRISHGYFSQFLSLQIILITSHFITLVATSNPDQVIPDLILYGLISLFSVLLLVITDKYVKAHPKLLTILAAAAFITTFFMNFFIPFYYKDHKPFGNLRPAYTTYLIVSNYIFLNIHNNVLALALGVFVSIFHLVTLILVTYEDHDRLFQRLGSDSIYLICINSLGIYFRYMNEIVFRRSFLDRRSCVESTHQLKFEEEQENHLLSSIIPQHIIAKVKKTLFDYIDKHQTHGNCVKWKPFDEIYVEEHPNVSILFADIVNYTAMTTELSVTELLDVLNELFGRFDDASEQLKVLRIKFLGDCYYCVAGLPPDPAPNHAEACVDLGLKMIAIIGDIRERKKLNINMRIGVHSGSISCGIIGNIKWQYDIWSTDVDIANKMETEGCAGMVHVTKETRALLRKSYQLTTSKKIVNGSRTYLITPPQTPQNPQTVPNGIPVREPPEKNIDLMGSTRRPSKFVKRTSISPNDAKTLQNLRSYSLISNYRSTLENEAENELSNGKRHTFPNSTERRISGNPGYYQRRPSGNARFSTDRRLTGDRKRRTAFMNNNIKRYKERLEETNKELEDTIENMLLSKFEQWFKVTDMFRILLIFKDLKVEWDFIKMPDPLFKYYLLSEVLLVFLVFILQNLTLSKWDWPEWPFYVTVGVLLLFFLPLSWAHHWWAKFFAKLEHDKPPAKIVKLLLEASKLVSNNVFVRLVIYTAVYILFCVCVLTEWLECYSDTQNGKNARVRANFLELIGHGENATLPSSVETHCIIPWHMTETCALAIIMSFLFLRMYMWLKLFYATAIAGVYSYCILNFSGTFYGDSQTFNFGLPPQVSHIMGVFFLTVIFHLVDRQTEYMNRIDHLWYKNLIEKEKQASYVHHVNNILLENILPKHVAELYLNVNRHSSDEVYHEYYNEAAVMFASITNFSVEEMGQSFLEKMSSVIMEFDMLLRQNNYGRPIEKIKVAKWTYMAACGLAPGLGDTVNIEKDHKDHTVIALLKFATHLMQTLKKINSEMSQDMKLRIGISHGYIAAGVVGSKKPFYDIWGDPVNMASRMDTTGLVDHIQVLKPTAEIIKSFKYVCKYRGEVEVKGRKKPVSTYFVALDEDCNLITEDNPE